MQIKCPPPPQAFFHTPRHFITARRKNGTGCRKVGKRPDVFLPIRYLFLSKCPAAGKSGKKKWIHIVLFSYFCAKLYVMNTNKPYILISNDDGYQAGGINFLIEALKPVADLVVMAPDRPRSGAGCSITSTRPLTFRNLHSEEGLQIYACTGTPSDCVKLALEKVVSRTPDLVVGGINHGNNASTNAFYSGTMGVAFEGALQGVPSIAFSLCNDSPDADFSPLRSYLVDLVFKSIAMGMPPYTCLNVNFPDAPKFAGVRVCRMARCRWKEEFTEGIHPHGQKYYWLAGHNVNLEPDDEDTDDWALRHQYVAVTPTRVDVTDYHFLDICKACL